MLSPKENLLRMYRGEMPEYIPNRGFREFKCSAFIDVKKPGVKRDEFGVEYTGKEEIFGGAPIPMPGHYVLDDITRWRDKIKAPDISDVDWEALAKKGPGGDRPQHHGARVLLGQDFPAPDGLYGTYRRSCGDRPGAGGVLCHAELSV